MIFIHNSHANVHNGARLSYASSRERFAGVACASHRAVVTRARGPTADEGARRRELRHKDPGPLDFSVLQECRVTSEHWVHVEYHTAPRWKSRK